MQNENRQNTVLKKSTNVIAKTSMDSAYISKSIIIEAIQSIAFTGSSAHTSAKSSATSIELIFAIYPIFKSIVINAINATANLTTGSIKCSYSPQNLTALSLISSNLFIKPP